MKKKLQGAQGTADINENVKRGIEKSLQNIQENKMNKEREKNGSQRQ